MGLQLHYKTIFEITKILRITITGMFVVILSIYLFDVMKL